jgi:hypothetical protein
VRPNVAASLPTWRAGEPRATSIGPTTTRVRVLLDRVLAGAPEHGGNGLAAVLLHDGGVLVAGGGDAGHVYSPATGTWPATGPMVYPFHVGSAVALLPNGQVLNVGGARLANCTPKQCSSEPVATAELYTP